MTTPAHTPTPWRDCDPDSNFQRGRRIIKSDDGSVVAEVTSGRISKGIANAAFIVRAVNEYAGNQSTIEWLKEHKDAGERARKELDGLKAWLAQIAEWTPENIGRAVQAKIAAIAAAEAKP